MSKVYSLEESLRELGKEIESFTEEVKASARKEVQSLAGQAHAMIADKAERGNNKGFKLKSNRQQYVDNLDLQKIESSGNNEIWAVVLYKPAQYLEDGQPKHNMIEQLLGSNATVKKGSNVGQPWVKKGKNGRYAAVPFEHSKPSSQMSLAQNKIADYVKKELKSRGLDKTITKNGKPVLGKAASLDLVGRGSPQHEKSWKPLLSGLTIYQREVKMKNGKSKIMRDVLTFRMVSDSQKGKGLWDHPGREGLHAFEEVEKELDILWNNTINKIVGES